MKLRFARVIAAAAVFFGSSIVVLLIALWFEVAPPELSTVLVPSYFVVQLGVPAVATWYIWRALNPSARQPNPAVGHGRRAGRLLIATAYVLTAALSAPMVQSRDTEQAVSEYKQLKATGSRRVFESHPHIWTYATIPVAPGVILSFHEYQLDGLNGFGGFDLSVWSLCGYEVPWPVSTLGVVGVSIACIGWGSLIWDHRELPIIPPWNEDGPMLPVEYLRHSVKRETVTLVLDPSAQPVQSLWVPLQVSDLGQAREALRLREGTVAKYIGKHEWRVPTHPADRMGNAEAPR